MAFKRGKFNKIGKGICVKHYPECMQGVVVSRNLKNIHFEYNSLVTINTAIESKR